MTASTSLRLDRAFFTILADWLAVGVAVTLPWSTSAAGICIAAWLVVLLPTLPPSAVKRELATAAGGLPVLLWFLAAVGMLWADVDWPARFAGLGGFNRLLTIPLLLAQFRRSDHGRWVVCAFLISSGTVLALSFLLVAAPELNWHGRGIGVPAHDDIFQSSEFLICGFALLGYAAFEGSRRYWAMPGSLATAALFFTNFGFVVVSRSALVVAPVLAILLGWRSFRWKGISVACIAAAFISSGFWFASPSLRLRVNGSVDELRDYSIANAPNDLGMHAAFLKESLEIIASAPIIGHGTGSIPQQFRRVTAGQTGASAVASVNPHNQTFAVAIQIGLAGGLVLWAMWVAHFLLFRSKSLAAWIGTVVVTENVVSSTVHSHLFDFANGWLYVFGVGVLGGMVLRERDGLPSSLNRD
jgi:hypothetical protein